MYIWDSPSNYNDSTTYKINHLELVTTIAFEKAHIFPMKKSMENIYGNLGQKFIIYLNYFYYNLEISYSKTIINGLKM